MTVLSSSFVYQFLQKSRTAGQAGQRVRREAGAGAATDLGLRRDQAGPLAKADHSEERGYSQKVNFSFPSLVLRLDGWISLSPSAVTPQPPVTKVNVMVAAVLTKALRLRLNPESFMPANSFSTFQTHTGSPYCKCLYQKESIFSSKSLGTILCRKRPAIDLQPQRIKKKAATAGVLKMEKKQPI